MIDDFIFSLPSEPYPALQQAMSFYEANRGKLTNKQLISIHAIAFDTLKNCDINFHLPSVSDYDPSSLGVLIRLNLDKLNAAVTQHHVLNLRKASIEKKTLPSETYSRIQTLINEIREQITESDNIDDFHKKRILDRLEKLQHELHNKITNYDVLLARAVQLGQVLGIIGKDIKPIVDRAGEICQAISHANPELESLPPGESSSFIPLASSGNTECDTN